jgi:hypothetical protein
MYKFVMLSSLLLYITDMQSNMTIKVPKECTVIFVSNNGVNTSTTQMTSSSVQNDLGPFKVAHDEHYRYVPYLLYASCGTYALLAALVEYYMYKIHHGIVARYNTNAQDLLFEQLYDLYKQDYDVDDALLQLYTCLHYERSCVRYLEKIVATPGARLLYNYRRACKTIQKYRKRFDLLFQHVTLGAGASIVNAHATA